MVCKVEGAYKGPKNVTKKGDPCMNWLKSSGFKNGSNYSRFGDNNFCHSTDGFAPWCFVGPDESSYFKCFENCPPTGTHMPMLVDSIYLIAFGSNFSSSLSGHVPRHLVSSMGEWREMRGARCFHKMPSVLRILAFVCGRYVDFHFFRFSFSVIMY